MFSARVHCYLLFSLRRFAVHLCGRVFVLFAVEERTSASGADVDGRHQMLCCALSSPIRGMHFFGYTLLLFEFCFI